MEHMHDNLGKGADSLLITTTMQARANYHENVKKTENAKKKKEERKKLEKKRQSSKNMISQDHTQPQMMTQTSARGSGVMTAQQLAQQQGQLIMHTQLHQHRLRGQYFSAYEQKPWYCDCAGTNIGCAGGTVQGQFILRDLAYWKCELDSRGLSKCGVTFCNACVIRDERLSSSPMAAQGGAATNPHAMFVDAARGTNSLAGGASAASAASAGGASMSSVSSFGSTSVDSTGKRKSGKLGATVYVEPGVVKKGWLMKRGDIVKSWKLRYFVLKDDRQMYYYSNEQTSTVKGVVQLFEVEQIIKMDNQIFTVQLKKGKSYHFSCKDAEMRDDWCLKLKALCKAPVMLAKAKKGKKGDAVEQKE